ncbi:hypothetical protein SeMB42_g04865 [Synchytrium endobioticum]|uniref:Symplekin n=1 Tax=Synchytrium endobioticum TaxID=286115 RepID=A0A507CV57_9FUNG|nr:hypothetical protein SeMB42_g04865 [Synchytrium endobioticum]
MATPNVNVQALILLNQLASAQLPDPHPFIALLLSQPAIIPDIAPYIAQLPLQPTAHSLIRITFTVIVEHLVCAPHAHLFLTSPPLLVSARQWMGTLLAIFEREIDHPVLLRAITSLANMYPSLFKLACLNPQAPWNDIHQMKLRLNTLFATANNGIKTAVIKMFQTAIVVQSPCDPTVSEGRIGLDLVQPQHPYLNVQALYAEAGDYLNKLVSLLHAENTSSGIMSAVVNSFLPLLRARPQFMSHILTVLQTLYTTPPAKLSGWELRNVERSIRNLLIQISRISAASPHHQMIHDAITMLAIKQENTKPRPVTKRSLPGSSSSVSKRSRVDSPAPGATGTSASASGIKAEAKATPPPVLAPPQQAIPPPQPLPNIDIDSLPIDVVIDIIMLSVNTIPQERWQAAIADYCVSNNLTPPPVVSGMTKNSASASAASQTALSAKLEQLPPKPEAPATPPPIGEPQDVDTLIISDLDIPQDVRTATVIEALKRVLYAEPILDHNQIATSTTTVTCGETLDEHKLVKNPKMTLGAARDAWMLIGSRVMGIVDPNMALQVRETLLQFFMQDCRGRYDFAVQWLFEEFMNDHKRAEEVDHRPQYPIWLSRVLKEMKTHLDVKDRTVVKLLLDVPSANGEEVQKVVLEYLRPAVRPWALDLLLQYCTCTENQLRKLSIVLVKRWVPEHPSLGPRILEFAQATLKKLLNISPSGAKPEEEGEELPEWSRLDIVRHLELFFALCSRNHDLLQEVLVLYKSLGTTMRQVIIEEVAPLIKSMGQGSSKLVSLLRGFPDGSEELALIILQTLTKDEALSVQLVNAVKHVLHEGRGDGRWIICVLPGLDKLEILSQLPKLIMLLDGTPARHAHIKDVFARLVDQTVKKESGILSAPVTTLVGAAPGGSSTAAASADTAVFASSTPALTVPAVSQPAVKAASAKLTPTELLITLHRLEDQVGLKKTMEAVAICFESPQVFKQEVLATTLQTLVELPKIPNLTMRTAIQAIQSHRGLQTFMNSILVRLISRKVWTEPKIWQGFVLCCQSLQPSCYPVLLTMEPERLRDFLNVCSKTERKSDGGSSIKSGLRKYISTMGDREKSRTQVQKLGELLGQGTTMLDDGPPGVGTPFGGDEAPATPRAAVSVV